MSQIGLFSDTKQKQYTPLAHRLRPQTLENFKGQEKILNRIKNLDLKRLPHIVFSGPPGTGKTTMAKILAKKSKLELFEFNAVLGGVSDLRKLIARTQEMFELEGKKSIIFIDEIHRFNKAQQDALLPYLERGDFVLFGATTESAQTSLNPAILSRVQAWRFDPLDKQALLEIVQRAIETIDIEVPDDITHFIVAHSNFDARSALNQVELLGHKKEELQSMNTAQIKEQLLTIRRRYDKDSHRHYDVISAFIKSVRGSDVNAAILWLAVMLDGGEDPEFITRRLIILASEDIGNADPRGLQMATSAHYAIKNIGMPEARIILAQATTYLTQAPKSNASYLAIDKALAYVKENPTIEVPTHLRNHHPDKKNYLYPHSYPSHWTAQDYLEKQNQEEFFQSTHLGYEKNQAEYLDRLKKQN